MSTKYLGTGHDDKDYGKSDQKVFANDGNDLVKGGRGRDTLYGENHNDTLYGQRGEDYLDGGNHNDFLDGGDNNDTLYGQSGSDTLKGGSAGDRLYGGNDNDRLEGQGQTDYLDGGSGNDYLDGGDDQDTLRGGADNGNQKGGNDTLKGGSNRDWLYGGNQDDFLYGQDGQDWLEGEDGNDLLYGGDDQDTLKGGGNKDTLYGDNGNDSLVGDAGEDLLYGNLGDDILQGGDNNDTLYGGNNRDSMWGGNHDDELHGGDNDDKLYGNRNSDLLFGDSGNDSLWGGYDHDILNGGSGGDYLDGGSGIDIAWYDHSRYSLSDDVDSNPKGVLINLATGRATSSFSGTDTLINIEGAWGSDYMDTIIGSSSDNTLSGGWHNDSIDGESGHDEIYGNQGNDTINGGDGNDKLNGDGKYHDGNDIITGGEGNDTIDGGGKYDVFLEKEYASTKSSADFVLTSDSLTSVDGTGTDSFINIEEVRLYSGSGDNSFTNNGFTGLSVAAYTGEVKDHTITNEGDNVWTVTGDGDDSVTGFDHIAFDHNDNPNVNSIFSTAHAATFLSVTAGVDNGTHTVTGGNYGPTNYLIGMEGSTDATLSFDTEKLTNFLADISEKDKSIEKQRLGAKLGFAIAKKAVPGGGVVTPVAEEFANYYYFDDAEAEAEARKIENALSDENYAPDSWIDFADPNRDMIRITDFQIGVDTIVLPSVTDDPNVYYQMKETTTGTTSGVTVSIKIGTNEAEDFLFIENNYRGDYGLTDAEFAEIILDLVQGSNEQYNGSTISTFKQTTLLVDPSDWTGTEGIGTYAGDHIQGAEYTGYSQNANAGSYSLIGKYGDDLLEGANKDDYLYGGYNSSLVDVTPFTYDNDGHDVLLGHGGNDTLQGGSGDDVLYGGEGADVFAFDSTNGIDIIRDFDGSEGDTIVIYTSVFNTSSLSDVTFNSSSNELSVNGTVIAELENPSGFDLDTDVSLL
ncbi:MAG: calcium-binding protein [Cyanobacteria bacterium J06592_8]